MEAMAGVASPRRLLVDEERVMMLMDSMLVMRIVL